MADVGNAAARTAIVEAYGAAQRKATLQASITVSRLWKELSSADLSGSWTAGVGAAVVRAITAGQLIAASTGQSYVDAVVAAEGAVPDYLPHATRVNYTRLAGVAADGRSLESLTYLPVIRTKQLLAGGVTLQQSLLGGEVDLQRIVMSEVADAGSGAASVAMAANRSVVGYLRQVRAGACARCVLLAGKWYRYNADFQRHKRCACYGVPATKARFPNHLNPTSFFNNLSRAEQDRRFGQADAQAIRDGADIYSVVNARRGMTTLDAYGRRIATTTEGTTRFGDYYKTVRSQAELDSGKRFARSSADVERGLPQFRLRTPRLMPAEIYRLTEDRLELIRLLRRYGYMH